MNPAEKRLESIGAMVRGIFTRNIGLKLVAAAIAVALFLVVRLQEKEERWIEVDVNVRRPTAEKGVALTSETPDSIRVLARGRSSQVRSVQKGERPQITVDLSRYDESGSFYYYFSDKDFGLGSGIELLDVDPQSMLVRLERLESKRLPVRVRTTGKVKAGAELAGQPVITPAELSISGPASLVRALEDIETEEIDIEGLGVGERVVEIPVRKRDGIDIRHAADSVEVVFQVRWTPGERVFAELPVRVAPEDPGVVEIAPSEVTVFLSGPQVMLDGIEPSAIRPRVVVPEDAPRPGQVRARVEVPGLDDGVTLSSVVPAEVQVRLSAAQKPKRQEQGAR